MYNQITMVNTMQKRPVVFLENAIFYLSLLFAAAVTGAFFYFRYSLDQNNTRLAGLSAQLAKIKTEEQKQLETRIESAGRKVSDFSKVMVGRKSSVEFFNGFENLVLGEIYFSKCDVDFGKMTATLSGHGKNFQDLGRQVAKFESASGVLESSTLGKAVTGEGGNIDFDESLVLKPEMVVFK